MATNYEITYSDGSLQFIVSPYSANGPVSPSGDALYPGAIKADTSLAIVGKGAEGYGERLQENMLHLLEHFFSEREPTYPTGGQIWYDRHEDNADVPRLKVFNAKKHVNISPIDGEIWIDGDLTARYGTGGGKLSKIRIFEPVVFTKEDYDISGIVYESVSKKTKISISNKKGNRTSWYIGGWDDLLISSDGSGYSITDALSSRIINVETDLTYPKDAVNVETLNAAFESTPIPLGNLSDVDMGITLHNDVLHFDSTDNKWKNINLSKAIQEEGDISLGGDLNVSGNTILGFGKDMDLNYKKIIKVGYPDEFDPNKEFHAVNVGYFLKKMPGGGDNGVSLLKHLSDVNTNLTPTANELLYYDGAEWTNLGIESVGNILSFIPLSGTTLGQGSLPYYLDEEALLHYNPASSFHTGEGNIREKVGTYGLVTLGMGDALWGEIGDTRVQFGSFDGTRNVIQLGYETANPQFPIVPGQPIPENPDGIEFSADIFSASHRAIDPKTVSTDGLYFEDSLAKTVETYPFVSLGEVIDVVNQSLGDIVSSPFRGMYAGANMISLPQTLGANYVVGKSHLQIYVNGLKQYASLKNWASSELLADASGFADITSYSIISSHVSTGGDDLSYLVIDGNEIERFNEIGNIPQSFDVTDEQSTIDSDLTVRMKEPSDDPDFEAGAQFDGGTETTIIYLSQDPSWDGEPPADYFIEVENKYNVGEKVWGGYPSGLKTDQVYMFKLTIDGNTQYPIVYGSDNLNAEIESDDNAKNIAQIVESLNVWSVANSSRFSVYLEGGHIYVFASESGNLTIEIENDITGATSFPDQDIDAVYDDPELPGVNMAFDTNSDVRSLFLPGLMFNVSNSPNGDNDGDYHVKETELLNGNVTRIFVQEIDQILGTAPGGKMIIEPLSLFESIQGGVTIDRIHYYYHFSDPSGWPKKSDNADMVFDGDYNEYGMTGFLSDTITWTNYPDSGDKVEVIIQNAVE